MLQPLVLAAGLLAAGLAPDTDKPIPDAAKGWIVELRGFTYHRDAAPKAKWIIEFHWPQPKPPLKIDPVETQYYADLRLFFEQLKKQKP